MTLGLIDQIREQFFKTITLMGNETPEELIKKYDNFKKSKIEARIKELESKPLSLSGGVLVKGDKIEVAVVLGTIGNNKVCDVATYKTVA